MDFRERLDEVEQASRKKIAKISQSLSGITADGISVAMNGSFARYEVTADSDFDFFVLHAPEAKPDSIKEVIERVQRSANEANIKLPAENGAFGDKYDASHLTINIGGNEDNNKNITNRVLFLLEGHSLNNPDFFEAQRRALIHRYLQDRISDHQLGLFLLNDFIRYYRTVCVDFEFKTHEGRKPWGIRNIKLIFSRKLIYFSGVLMVAETAQRSVQRKREKIEELVQLTPIQRIQRICGGAADRALQSYVKFLDALDDQIVRGELENVTQDQRQQSSTFRDLKDEGQHFSSHLLSALHATYPPFHPIYRALVL